MNKTPLLALLLVTAALGAQAAANVDEAGPYLSIGLAHAHFGYTASVADKHERNSLGTHLALGYRFNPTWGAEVGYAALGRLQDNTTVGAATVKQDLTASSLYAVGTATLPLTGNLSLHGKLGVGFGRVSGPITDAGLRGSQTSLVGGIGLDYKLTRTVTLTADVNHYGKVSDQVRATGMGVGARVAF